MIREYFQTNPQKVNIKSEKKWASDLSKNI